MRLPAVAALLVLLAIAPVLHGQSNPAPLPSLNLEARWQELSDVQRPPSIPSSSPNRGRNTVTGLLIGGAIGLAVGYGLYNGLCEAVDNRCADSRARLMFLSGGVGASLGALLGALAE
jgi:hypothetical protein